MGTRNPSAVSGLLSRRLTWWAGNFGHGWTKQYNKLINCIKIIPFPQASSGLPHGSVTELLKETTQSGCSATSRKAVFRAWWIHRRVVKPSRYPKSSIIIYKWGPSTPMFDSQKVSSAQTCSNICVRQGVPRGHTHWPEVVISGQSIVRSWAEGFDHSKPCQVRRWQMHPVYIILPCKVKLATGTSWKSIKICYPIQ